MAESIVTLRVEARNAISSLNKTSAATKTLSNSAKGATASLTTASAAAKGLGASLAASLGPLITVGAAIATVGNAIGTFTARERDIAILTQGLKNLGEGTVALNELQKAADKLGNQTLFNQEEFTRGFNLLTSFRNIGVDSYTRVAQAAADIAQVNQVDVSTSFMQLAKALQDPERNLSNLNRSGIAFTKTQTDVIKELMKTNKTAEAHAMILSIVEESYNKLAQAAAEGFAGNVDSLGEAFRDFSETLGKTLEPALIAVTKGLTKLLKAANDFINSPISGTAAIFTGIALAAKGIPVLMAAVGIGLMKVAAAGGVLTIALNALPFVAVATAAGAFITAIIKATEKQRDFTKALKEGDEQALKSEFNRLFIERQKLLQRLAIAQDNNNKRAVNSLQKQLDINEAATKPIKQQLDNTREIANQNRIIAEKKEDQVDLQKELNKLEKENLKKAIAYDQAEMDAVKAKGELIDQLSKQRALARAAIDGNLEQVQIQQQINALVAIHGEGMRDVITAYIEGTEALKKQKDEADELKNKFDEIGESIESSIKDNLREAIIGAQSFGEAMTNVLNRIRNKIIDAQIDKLLGNFGESFGSQQNKGGLGGFLGSIAGGLLGGLFANGGRPPVGKASVVGERGPELFVPKVAGTIIPNNVIGGGNTTNNTITINVDASGTSVQGSGSDADQLGGLIASVVQATIIDEQRAGGLLNR